jgi:hypothetical protein
MAFQLTLIAVKLVQEDALLTCCRHNILPFNSSDKSCLKYHYRFVSNIWVRVIVFNATFNNISIISCRSVLLPENHWQTLSHNVVWSIPRHERDSHSQL